MYHWASLLLTETVNKTEQRVSVGIHCGSTCGSSHLVSWGDCGLQTVYRQSTANFGLVNFAWRPHYYCIYHTQVPIIIILRLLSYLVIKYGTNKYFRTYWYLVPANTFKETTRPVLFGSFQQCVCNLERAVANTFDKRLDDLQGP